MCGGDLFSLSAPKILLKWIFQVFYLKNENSDGFLVKFGCFLTDVRPNIFSSPFNLVMNLRLLIIFTIQKLKLLSGSNIFKNFIEKYRELYVHLKILAVFFFS